MMNLVMMLTTPAPRDLYIIKVVDQINPCVLSTNTNKNIQTACFINFNLILMF